MTYQRPWGLAFGIAEEVVAVGMSVEVEKIDFGIGWGIDWEIGFEIGFGIGLGMDLVFGIVVRMEGFVVVVVVSWLGLGVVFFPSTFFHQLFSRALISFD